MSSWALEFEGDRRRLADWGIINPKLETQSLAGDTLSFEIAVASISTEPPFPYGATLDLYFGDTRRFRGLVTRLRAIGSGAGERCRYVVSGPWWQLDNLVYQDTSLILVDPANPESSLTPIYNSQVVLFQTHNFTRRTNGEQITNILEFARSKGVGFTIGTIEPAIYVPWEEGRDLSCGEALKRCSRWQPDLVQWFDYSTTPPTIHFKRRASLDAVELDLNGGTAIDVVEINPREDLQPAGVKLYIVRRYVGDNGRAHVYQQTLSAGDVGDGVGSIVMTIALEGSANGDDTSEEEPVPATLAIDYLASISTLQYEGSITLKEEEASGSLRVGNVLNLTNGRAAWATMIALIQTVEEDLNKGETVVRFGPPSQLSVQNFIELARAARRRDNSTGQALARKSGISALTPSISLPETELIEVCDKDTKSPKTIAVRRA